MTNISDWSTTAASNNGTVPNGWPENMALSDVNNCARQNMADVRGFAEELPWFDYGHTPTYVSGTSFTIPTDLTAIYAAGRRLQLTDSTTLYATIASSSYSAPNTTVSVTLDSGSLSVSLTAVKVGIVTTNSLPSGGTSVTAAAVIADNAVVRGDGGARGTQSSGVIIDDSNNVTGANRITSRISLGANTTTLTIATGSVTLTSGQSAFLIDTEGAAATDDLDTIATTDVNGGDIISVTPASSSRDVTIKHATGNIRLRNSADYKFLTSADMIMLKYNATLSVWEEVGRKQSVADNFGQLLVGAPTAAASPAAGDVNAKRFLKDGVEIGTTLGTAAATTSGTSVSITGIAAGVNQITVTLNGVSTNGTSRVMLQIGDSGGVETTGYIGNGGYSTSGTEISTGFPISDNQGASDALYGSYTLTRYSGNEWICSWNIYQKGQNKFSTGGGSKTLSATLDRVSLTTVGGADTFDAGGFNVVYI